MRVTEKWLKSIRKSNIEKPRNLKHGMSGTKFYKTWINMNRRCTDKNSNRWDRYGGRGIKCEWKSFEEFRDDMYKKYLEHVEIHGEKYTQIDRINNNGNYCKENCKWSTPIKQSNNRNNNIFITFKNRKMTIMEWSRETKIHESTLRRRYNKGWSPYKILNTKVDIKKRNKRYDTTA